METDKKICRSCASEIPKKAKICPHCRKNARSWMGRHPIIVGALCLSVLGTVTNLAVPTTAPIQSNYVMPEYSIIDQVDLYTGGKLLDALVSTYSKETPNSELLKGATKLSEIHRATRVDLYCSEEAQKANYSAKFAEENPEAIECYLGKFEF